MVCAVSKYRLCPVIESVNLNFHEDIIFWLIISQNFFSSNHYFYYSISKFLWKFSVNHFNHFNWKFTYESNVLILRGNRSVRMRTLLQLLSSINLVSNRKVYPNPKLKAQQSKYPWLKFSIFFFFSCLWVRSVDEIQNVGRNKRLFFLFLGYWHWPQEENPLVPLTAFFSPYWSSWFPWYRRNIFLASECLRVPYTLCNAHRI